MKKLIIVLSLAISCTNLVFAKHEETLKEPATSMKTYLKSIGGTLAGAATGFGLIELLALLLEDEWAHKSRPGILLASIVGGMGALIGGFCTWRNTAEGQAYLAREALQNYKKTLFKIIDNNSNDADLLNALDLQFSTHRIGRVAAYRELAQLRDKLVKGQEVLSQLMENEDNNWLEYYNYYNPLILEAIAKVNNAILTITNDPSWTTYLHMQQMAEMADAARAAQFQTGVVLVR